MQVSWIDKDHLQALVARLEESAPRPPAERDLFPEPQEIISMPEFGGFFDEEEKQPAPAAEEPSPDVSMLPDPPPVASHRYSPAPPDRPAAPDETQPLEHEDASLPLERIRERLRAIRHRAVEAGLLNRPEPTPSDDVPPTPAPEIAVQVEPDLRTKIAHWAQSVITELSPADTLMVMDDQGDVLWSNEPRPGLILSTLMAMRAARHASVEELANESVVSHHALPPNHMLSVSTLISCMGSYVQVAAKSEAPIAAEQIASWREELGQ